MSKQAHQGHLRVPLSREHDLRAKACGAVVGMAVLVTVPTCRPLVPALSWPVSIVSSCALFSEKPDREGHGVLENLPGEGRETGF